MYKIQKKKAVKKKKNEHNRKRDIIVNFRMSPMEREELDERVRLSGRKKQDYMIQSSLHQKLVVVGDKRMFLKLQESLGEIEKELKRVVSADAIDMEKIVSLRTVAEIIYGMSVKADQ